MFWNFASDFRLLRDDHGLESYWVIVEPQVANEFFETVVLQCDAFKVRVEFVQGVADLVDCLVFGPC